MSPKRVTSHDGALRFVRFLAMGGTAAAVNWLSRIGFSLFVPFEVALVLSHAVGMVVAFVLFRLFVFPASPLPVRLQVRNFTIVNLIGMGLTIATASLLKNLVFPAIGFDFHAPAVAHAIGIALPVATSWFGHRRFTFASTPAARP